MNETDHVEMEPGSQKEIKCKVREEVKSHWKSCICSRKKITIRAIGVL